MKKTHLLILYVVIVALILAVIYYRETRHMVGPNKIKPGAAITNFEECAAAGNPIMESYPERCSTPDGRSFTRVIPPESAPASPATPGADDTDKSDLITVSSPLANSAITSPLTITGQARGNWYFEASFPVRLEDANGKILAQAPAMAQGEWMTENFVPFSVKLSFAKPQTGTGKLILQKDNPSGLPENDNKLEIPVRFE